MRSSLLDLDFPEADFGMPELGAGICDDPDDFEDFPDWEDEDFGIKLPIFVPFFEVGGLG